MRTCPGFIYIENTAPIWVDSELRAFEEFRCVYVSRAKFYSIAFAFSEIVIRVPTRTEETDLIQQQYKTTAAICASCWIHR